MVSDFTLQMIDEANALINEGTITKEAAYCEQAVKLLKNLKYRIHEEILLNEIKIFEKEHDEKLKQMLAGIENSGDDPLRKRVNTFKQYELNSLIYLRKYLQLTKDYDF